MSGYDNKKKENKSKSVASSVAQMQTSSEPTFEFQDTRPDGVAQMKLKEMANNSSQVSQLQSFQEMANNSSQTKQVAQLQAMADTYSAQQYPTIQRQENNTGLPDTLKSGMENLSGLSMDDVKVHRNSVKPAQLNAHAYAQGTDIHLGSGQEKHLPHELGHVVQQKEGRVKPTKQLKGKTNINDDSGLEKEADTMGAKAASFKNDSNDDGLSSENIIQKKSALTIVQRFETMDQKRTRVQAAQRGTVLESGPTLNMDKNGVGHETRADKIKRIKALQQGTVLPSSGETFAMDSKGVGHSEQEMTEIAVQKKSQEDLVSTNSGGKAMNDDFSNVTAPLSVTGNIMKSFNEHDVMDGGGKKAVDSNKNYKTAVNKGGENLAQTYGAASEVLGVGAGMGKMAASFGDLADDSKHIGEKTKAGFDATSGAIASAKSSTEFIKRARGWDGVSDKTASGKSELENFDKTGATLGNVGGVVDAGSSLMDMGNEMAATNKDYQQGRFKDKEGNTRYGAASRAAGRNADKVVGAGASINKAVGGIASQAAGSASAVAKGAGVAGGVFGVAGGTVGMGKAAWKYRQSRKRSKKIKTAQDGVDVNSKRGQSLAHMQEIMSKRKKSAGFEGVTSALDTAAGGLALSVVGAPIGAILGGVSTTMKAGRYGARKFKQWGRDKQARRQRGDKEIGEDRKNKRAALESASQAKTGWNPFKKVGKWNSKRKLDKMNKTSDSDYLAKKQTKYGKEDGRAEKSKSGFFSRFNSDKSSKKKVAKNNKLVEHLMANEADRNMFSGGTKSEQYSKWNDEEKKAHLLKRVKQR